jgi:ABC-type nitrate/sulfonate/bicarbonate transport system ATPase subunit
VAALHVTHDPQEAAAVADRVVTLAELLGPEPSE